MENNKLSITEIRYIRTLASKKTDQELAEMIGKPIAVIQMQFSLMSGLPKRPWEKGPEIKSISLPKSPKKKKIRRPEKKRISHADRKLIREKKKKDQEKQKRESQSLHVQEQERLTDRKKKLERSKFATRPLDLTGTIRVKLNEKTIVWVKPGTDIEKLKKQLNIK